MLLHGRSSVAPLEVSVQIWFFLEIPNLNHLFGRRVFASERKIMCRRMCRKPGRPAYSGMDEKDTGAVYSSESRITYCRAEDFSAYSSGAAPSCC